MKKIKFPLLAAVLTLSFIGVTAFDNTSPKTKTVNIRMTVDEAGYVISILRKQPYEQSADIIASIINQANSQLVADTAVKKK